MWGGGYQVVWRMIRVLARRRAPLLHLPLSYPLPAPARPPARLRPSLCRNVEQASDGPEQIEEEVAAQADLEERQGVIEVGAGNQAPWPSCLAGARCLLAPPLPALDLSPRARSTCWSAARRLTPPPPVADRPSPCTRAGRTCFKSAARRLQPPLLLLIALPPARPQHLLERRKAREAEQKRKEEEDKRKRAATIAAAAATALAGAKTPVKGGRWALGASSRRRWLGSEGVADRPCGSR